jgi:putative molybdopterin biosynthesis protein
MPPSRSAPARWSRSSRPAGTELAPGELADTNSIMLAAQARETGCRAETGPIVPDDPERLAAALRAAAARADLVLLVAGTSAGRGDHAPDVLRRCGRIVASGVAIRPGHPVVLAVVDGTPVMGCPGYPVSAALAFSQLARPLLEHMGAGAPARERPAVAAQLAADVTSKPGADEFLRVALGTVAGRRVAVPLRRGASVLSSLARADGLVTVGAAQTQLRAGAPVRAEVLRPEAVAGPGLLVAGAPGLALDLLLLACTDAGVLPALCEMPDADALALLARGGCHAAVVDAGAATPDGAGVARLPLAEREIGVAAAAADPATELHRPGARIVAAPAAAAFAPPGIGVSAAVRSDAAAVDAVAQGHADAALTGLPAARAAGLAFQPLGRAALELCVLAGASGREPCLRALHAAIESPAFASILAAAGYAPAHPTRRAA